jgi:polyhydroxyalkanoate synthesis regulator protein
VSSHGGAILIKRYDRSRLYDTEHGRYVAVSELRDWQRRGIPFVVVDSETGDDITRVLLA